jgi:hypothetical protein
MQEIQKRNTIFSNGVTLPITQYDFIILGLGVELGLGRRQGVGN